MPRSHTLRLAALAVFAGAPACTPPPAAEQTAPVTGLAWIPQESGTTASFRGISVVSPQEAWASGTGGAVLRTTDGGATWQRDTVPGATALDFRDVHTTGTGTAYLMSIGEGPQSRIYRTTDAGRSWTLQYTVPGPQGFLDGMAFRGPGEGFAYSDPVDGRFLVLATRDGEAWSPVPPQSLPPALPDEAGFAASGTGIAVHGDRVWFGTGGGAQARVFRSEDGGRTWAVSPTPMAAGSPGAGVFSLAFWNEREGIAVGGDYTKPQESAGNVAKTTDGGRTWRAIRGAPPRGYRSGVAFVPGTDPRLLIAVGTSGSDYSIDGGESWTPIDTVGYNAVAAAGPDAVWAVGPGGKVAKLRIGRER
ncbi:MAG TPA: YCF48-related protein [Longimicrobiaceae bacterium]|nr:YCF48-related protein [Longimicrobiaceae bacterium]